MVMTDCKMVDISSMYSEDNCWYIGHSPPHKKGQNSNSNQGINDVGHENRMKVRINITKYLEEKYEHLQDIINGEISPQILLNPMTFVENHDWVYGKKPKYTTDTDWNDVRV